MKIKKKNNFENVQLSLKFHSTWILVRLNNYQKLDHVNVWYDADVKTKMKAVH
jgi:hypothetical protein